ncbi:aromatic ring-hydroxylating oxygenase subunit alpha [Alteromonas lipolytica]|uniref:aromatic ring-hydroxylating oxygenase subunit alpha n=1 Tax=Alteromonas lipolytica TaxID=1856405 RepID=UPI0009F6AD32|nr:SRPBCC family protein [Alteromonas lipolytica]GGF72142.1 (2Fe-2S)-binding protein [Alteromonas lipolytica]
MVQHPSIESYFDPASSKAETDFAFAKGLNYAGHTLMVPEKFSYQVLPHYNDRYVLFNQGEGYDILSNVCLHRQAKLLDGNGRTRHIVCRLHCWGYDNHGQLKGAPHFEHKPAGKLKKEALNSWHGLLFRGRVPNMDLTALGLDTYINFDDYFFAGMETTQYHFNWKSFAEIYLENYHVFSMHPGLRQFVKPADLTWEFGADYSVQKVGLADDLLKATTPNYRHFQDNLVQRFGNEMPRYGAIWCYIYPNIMIEWYPEVLVISTVYPRGARQCTNHVEFYYPRSCLNKESGYFTAHKKAYMETAVEDEEACLLLEQGREALYLAGEEEYGPIESFLEAGVAEFYCYLSR